MLIDLLTQLKSFKFGTTLFLVVKKIESDDKTEYDTFHTKKQKQLLMKVTLWCIWINLYYNYIKHTKVFRKYFRLDCWFSHRS